MYPDSPSGAIANGECAVMCDFRAQPTGESLNTAFVHNVDAARATQMAESGATLLDVREDHEWKSGHVPGAVHVPLGQLDPASLPTDLTIIAVCRSGNRSSKAAEVLASAGRDVVNLEGGMQAWLRAGLPVVSDDGHEGSGR